MKKSRNRWTLGTCHDHGGLQVWEGYEHCTLTQIIMTAYAIIEEQPYHPENCPERVVIMDEGHVVWEEYYAG